MRVCVDESKKAESLFKDERIVETAHRKEKTKNTKNISSGNEDHIIKKKCCKIHEI